MPTESATATRVAPVPSSAVAILQSVESWLAHIARRRALSCVLVTALCLFIRLAILPIHPKPQPREHDEFAYIFGAETLAQGRLANPTHPMWRFFETYHINMQPTYVSKYPPAQSAFLALGIRLFGHPWYGVLMSVALMCGAMCWMLQGWFAPKYALLGGLFAVLQFSATHYWIDSYWGGSVAAVGGALVLGALPRLARGGTVLTAFIMSAGIAMLANSRPFEGLVLVTLAAFALIAYTRNRLQLWFRLPVVTVIAVTLTATAAAMAYYNLRTTGSFLTFPYSLNQQRYSAASLFWLMPPYPHNPKEYRDASMRELWESWDVGRYTQARHNPAIMLFRLYEALRDFVGAGAGIVVILFAVCAVPLFCTPRLQPLCAVLALFLFALLLNKYIFAHYIAPATGAVFIIAMSGCRLLRCLRIGRRPVGLGLVASLGALAVVLFAFNGIWAIRGQSQGISFRRQVLDRLNAEPGKHLVFVRYSPIHNFHDEFVYNTPDIDAQKIVWAFDFGQEGDRPLLDYYRGRRVWLAQPDGPMPNLSPY